VNGTPREAFVPSILVDAGAPGEDPALAAALRVLDDPQPRASPERQVPAAGCTNPPAPL
jgi:hypothetical protein